MVKMVELTKLAVGLCVLVAVIDQLLCSSDVPPYESHMLGWSPIFNRIAEKMLSVKSLECLKKIGEANFLGKTVGRTGQHGPAPYAITRDTEFLDLMALGARLAMQECREAFKWERWNCPETSFGKNFRRTTTREKAFTDAIFSAGIVHTITRACSDKGSEMRKYCGCMPNRDLNEIVRLVDPEAMKYPDVTPYWRGCSPDVRRGEDIVMRYVEKERALNAEDFAFNHNSRIGREAVRQALTVKCNCHGPSATCAMRSCYLQLAPLTKIAQILKTKYSEASRIHFNEDGSVRLGNTLSASHFQKMFPKKVESRMVYTSDSPNYCYKNQSIDWPGTSGRMCSQHYLFNTTRTDRRSCNNLCKKCGHAVKSRITQVTTQCNCTFRDNKCCDIVCEECLEDLVNNFCT